ncbi:MAG: DUF3048 C-terminal domain-containing protein [Oscillospiraceae bacterium]|nr:DUF3048 C-terminal domain-containing protein [Oscillospiraceae bacterium]
MKKLFVWVLVLALLLSGCAGTASQEETTAETTAPTQPETEPTTVPTEPPVYRNPLNGQILDEPYTGRIYAHTITNTPDALPHVNAVKADILVEAYVSRGVSRCLGLFTNIGEVEAIGGTRSTRLLFNQIAHLYDAILIHGGGFGMVLEDADHKGLDHFNVDSLYRQQDPLAQKVAYRDKQYRRYAPNDLLGYGPGIVEYVEAQGVRTTQPADKDYYLRFLDDATPVNGEPADEITIYYGFNTKNTVMKYNPETGKYVYHQYVKVMTDQITGEEESFNNVLILRANVYENYIYTEATFHTGGTGYFACGGKIIPIVWECANEHDPFNIKTLDGEPLHINVGNTYMGIIGFEKERVEWKEVIPPETQPPVTEPAQTEPETTTQETAAATVPETTAQMQEKTVETTAAK